MKLLIEEYGGVVFVVLVGGALIGVLSGLLDRVIDPKEVGWFFEFFN